MFVMVLASLESLNGDLGGSTSLDSVLTKSDLGDMLLSRFGPSCLVLMTAVLLSWDLVVQSFSCGGIGCVASFWHQSLRLYLCCSF